MKRSLVSRAYAEFFLSSGGLPLFSTFFLWSFGTGAIQLARPLMAASFVESVFLVSLIISTNGIARLITAPITGVFMDRWGRKPILIVGVVLRGVTAFLEFFCDNYWQFLILECIGGIGVSIWATGSNILIADVSGVHNRGMAVATRGFSIKLGSITGPLVGGLIAYAFGLRWIFIFNAITKVVQLAIMLWLIRETRPDRVPEVRAEGQKRPRMGVDWGLYWNRPFLAVTVATLGVSVMTSGIFQSLFPVYSKFVVGLAELDIGTIMTAAAVLSLLVSFPNGWVVDHLGRRASLTPGLMVLAGAAVLLATGNTYWGIVVAMAVYGIGEGMGQGSSQAAAMDLAPEQKRGEFLGVWSMLQNAGSVIAPVLIGGAADLFGYGTTFLATAVALTISALLFWMAGADVAGRKPAPVPAVVPAEAAVGGRPRGG